MEWHSIRCLERVILNDGGIALALEPAPRTVHGSKPENRETGLSIVDCRLSIRCRFFGDVLQSAIFPDCRLSIVATVRPYTLCSGMNLLDVNQN